MNDRIAYCEIGVRFRGTKVSVGHRNCAIAKVPIDWERQIKKSLPEKSKEVIVSSYETTPPPPMQAPVDKSKDEIEGVPVKSARPEVEKKYTCDICKYSTSKRSDLDRHSQTKKHIENVNATTIVTSESTISPVSGVPQRSQVAVPRVIADVKITRVVAHSYNTSCWLKSMTQMQSQGDVKLL